MEIAFALFTFELMMEYWSRVGEYEVVEGLDLAVQVLIQLDIQRDKVNSRNGNIVLMGVTIVVKAGNYKCSMCEVISN